ncbi:hypothetical protein AYK20_09440 [Thermoplasmatales archaeon SG8-52-1]|nr:MAG: hypothetical protein AYK20_09440 [Thermoplasmatales archaeon SG8-52-1]
MISFRKLLTIIIIALLIISSVYIVFYLDNNSRERDNTEPTIDYVTGDTTCTAGKITTIEAIFSDNINVTEAFIIYKSASDNEWQASSIISGSIDIQIPANAKEDYYYYITVDDAAGNGPIGDPSNDGSVFYTITVTEDIVELSHTVFIEEATGETCTYCPGVSEVIEELYKSGDYNFYYVSMVADYPKALDHLNNDYNLYAQPTVFIDGGFKVELGGGKTKEDVDISKYIEAITTAENRNVPKIMVNVTIDYKNGSNNFTTNVAVKNYEETTYTGTLKVHLAEIVSRWNYKAGGNIHNAFLDYIIDEEISVEAGKEYKKSENWVLSNEDIPDNLIVIAVVFNSDPVEKYSFPSENKNLFNAYFADATDGAYVIAGGDLPPSVNILNPVSGKLHIFGTPIFDTIFKATKLIGPTKITVNASDDSKIDKVEFYVDNKIVNTDNEAPYEYTLKRIGLFKSIFFRKHIIKVIAYDDTGKTATDEIEVKARL